MTRLTQPLGHRGDIQGLRGVAVLLVLLLHAGLPVDGGFVGVDVFFVISGFLITSLLYDELVRTRRVSLRRFYARRARRLLPAVAVVLAATVLMTLTLLPRTRWRGVGFDTLASALYVQNWRLAELSVDYQAQDLTRSPLQHFWSLAVEEQFYLVWPLLLLLVAFLVRTGRGRRRAAVPLTEADPTVQRRAVRVLVGGMVVVTVASYAWSVRYTDINPAGAYFVTTTRLWELALGGLIAVFAVRLAQLPAVLLAVIGWVGLGAVGVAAAFFSGATAFPGAIAAMPVLGAAAVLVAGLSSTARGPRLLLDLAPLRWVGELSYSVYLWHWPLLVMATARWGSLAPWQGVVVVAVSFVPAYLSYRYVENPIRRSTRYRRDPSRSLSLGAFLTASAVAGGFLVVAVTPPAVPVSPLQVSLDDGTGQQPETTTPKVGAMVLAADPRDDRAGAPTKTSATIYPDPLSASNDTGQGFCGATIRETAIRTCSGGDTSSKTDVLLVGDSHAQQWTTALYLIGQKRGWKVTGMTKAACPLTAQEIAFAVDDQGNVAPTRSYSECAQFDARVLARLTASPPAMVVMSSGDHVPMVDGVLVGGDKGAQLLRRGYQQVMDKLLAKGIKVVVLADTPAPLIDIPECVAQHRNNLTECTVSRTKANEVKGKELVAAAKAEGRRVTLIDLGDAICPTSSCAPVIGGVVVWRDISHLTASYVSTLAPRLNALLPDLK